MRRLLAALILILLAGCASSGAQPTNPRPEIEIVQTSKVPYVARDVTGPISVQYALAIKNPSAQPIELRSVELSSVGGGAYDLSPVTRTVKLAIAPGATVETQLWAPAIVPMATVAGANGPVTLRVRAVFEVGGKQFETYDVRNVNPYGGE